MGHLFQVECWKKHPSGHSFRLLWLSKLAKEMEKTLERNEELIGIIFMKIMEIRRKGGERLQVACEEENKGK